MVLINGQKQGAEGGLCGKRKFRYPKGKNDAKQIILRQTTPENRRGQALWQGQGCKTATSAGGRHPVKLGLVGDIRTTLQQLLPRLSERHDDNFLQACQTLPCKSLRWRAAREKPGHSGLMHPQYRMRLICEGEVVRTGHAPHRHHGTPAAHRPVFGQGHLVRPWL